MKMGVVYLGFGLLVASTVVAEVEQTIRMKIDGLQRRELIEEGLLQQLDVAGVDVRRGIVDVIGDDEVLEMLRDRGIRAKVVRNGTRGLSPEYKNFDEVVEILKKIAEENPSIVQLTEFGKTHEQRPMLAVKISDNVEVDEIEPTVVFNSLHHAREVMTIEVTLDVIDILVKGYAENPAIAAWIDNYEIWIVPVVNPDGLSRVWGGSNMWRKNAYSTTWGTWGVDLNRNYPRTWNSCGGSSGSTWSDTYRGPHEASEPETTAMMDFYNELRPIYSISYHSYSELVLYPYGCDGKRTPEHEVVKIVGDRLAEKLENDDGVGTYQPGLAWDILYAVDGDDISYLYAAFGTLPYVIEVNGVGQGFQPDYNKWRDVTVERQRPGWGFVLEAMSHYLLSGVVADAETHEPLAASVYVRGTPYGSLETPRESAPKTGEFYKVLLPGSHELAFVREGYETEFITVDQGEEPQTLMVELRRKQR